MASKERICVDFDNTIFDGRSVLPNCVYVLSKLRERYNIAIFSARATDAEREHMKQVLDNCGVPYDEILPPKPNAVAYIDDKGIRFTSWDNINY